MRSLIYFLVLSLFLGCKSQEATEIKFFEAQDTDFTYTGRTTNSDEGKKLITSAASVRANVYGDTVSVFLRSENEQHHYVAVELNSKYQGRFKITNDTLHFALPHPDSANVLTIYKETEASNGSLIFKGLRAQNIKRSKVEKRAKIEFIGDSITCGMGADTGEIGCSEGEWFDQHTAYMAYGSRVARALNLNYELNCVSGMGMYRNWNDEDQPVMPDVYPYLHLNSETNKRVEIDEKDAPQIVSIALGTNDFSLGDGEKSRSPFNAEKFKQNYIDFINSLFEIYPETKIALISSPMTGKDEGNELIEILMEIKDEFSNRTVEVFPFEKMEGRGCTGHPSVADHEWMAEKLIPFYRNLLTNNH